MPSKRKPERPSESLCPRSESVDLPVSGTRKAACKSGATLDLTSDSLSASASESQVVLRQMKRMLDSFQAQLRIELKSLVTEPLAGLVQICDDLQTTVSEQRFDINRLSAENRRLRTAVDKYSEPISKVENGAKTTIAEVKGKFAAITARHPVATATCEDPADTPNKAHQKRHSATLWRRPQQGSQCCVTWRYKELLLEPLTMQHNIVERSQQ